MNFSNRHTIYKLLPPCPIRQAYMIHANAIAQATLCMARNNDDSNLMYSWKNILCGAKVITTSEPEEINHPKRLRNLFLNI